MYLFSVLLKSLGNFFVYEFYYDLTFISLSLSLNDIMHYVYLYVNRPQHFDITIINLQICKNILLPFVRRNLVYISLIYNCLYKIIILQSCAMDRRSILYMRETQDRI